MTHFQFIDKIAAVLGVQGKNVIWAIPGGGATPRRPTQFELFWDGVHEGRPMLISKIVTEAQAPEVFAAYFGQL